MINRKSVATLDAKRDIGNEALRAIREVKTGKYGTLYKVEANDVVKARLQTGVSGWADC